MLFDALLGRRVLFLAAPNGQAPGQGARDLYRARVRVSPEGQPIDVRGLSNLTETPLGDEAGLEVRGRSAAFATTAFGRVQGVSFLDLTGPTKENGPSGAGRLLFAATSLRKNGSLSGIGRLDVVMNKPAAFAKFTLTPPHARVLLEDPNQSFDVDLNTLSVHAEASNDSSGYRVVNRDYSERSQLTWSVDLVRSIVGPAPIAFLESVAFGVRDFSRRTAASVFGPRASRLKAIPPDPAPHVLSTPTSSVSGDEGWPPEDIASLWETPRPGEGKWLPVNDGFLPRLAADGRAPPYFYTTTIHPDADRPYAEVLLVAMDMRQLELGMEGGYEEPRPLTGPPGTGRIPRDPSVSSRVVAAFNGAFRAEHGQYGMMVQKRVLLPPVAGAATVLVRSSGEAGFGTWPPDTSIPDDVTSFRQNLDPLVSDGIANPTGRNVWGLQIIGESTLTERTAICLSRGRHVYFAWGREVSGHGLAKALRQAGCDYAVHLDMNARHCGFVFMQAPTEAGGKGGHYRLADSGMSVNPSRYVQGSDKDFFYVMRRDVGQAEGAGEHWLPSPGTQPPPVWLSGIHETRQSVGELSIRVVEFDGGRVDWIVRSGKGEPSTPGARPKKVGLESSLDGRVVASVGLGHTTESLRYGMAFDGVPVLDLRRSYATVVLARGQAPVIVKPGDVPVLAPGDEAVQLPLLADHGEVDARAGDRGGQRERGALCVTPSGRVLVALGRHDSNDPLAAALVELGCQRVVGLDRGSRHDAFVHRAGTSDAPLDSYGPSVLYAVSRGMTPRASRVFEQPVR
jgi:hypothetical protein